MRRGKSRDYSLDLFHEQGPETFGAAALTWPDLPRFPLNLEGRKVAGIVERDLLESKTPLIVTGYAGLDRLLDFCGGLPDSVDQLQVLFGNEPFAKDREEYNLEDARLPEEVESYWVSEGVSLTKSAALLHMIELLNSGRVEARYLGSSYSRLHAKIFVGDGAATLGSSNFTRPGFEKQLEANARFPVEQRSKRYAELKQIAENYWQLGRAYNQDLVELLKKLLKVVSWHEALARACAELLEGEWAARYLDETYLLDGGELWPSQRQGIAQALYVLSRQGSVLVADATGSGKTKLGAHLIRAIMDGILRSGRLRRGTCAMVCPPAVAEAWNWEKQYCHAHLEVFSQGMLSQSRSRQHKLVVSALRSAQVLCVDEGHNFLNLKSNRTSHLLRNMADHMVLFTATPINKSATDLLRMADMLGADNLDPVIVKSFSKMLGKPNPARTLTKEEIDELRRELKKFTVRRTKKMLNDLIDREPDKYVGATGNLCRFPKHRPKIYTLNESDEDRETAARIRKLADELVGVSHFVKPLRMPPMLAERDVTQERYLAGRLKSAGKLSRYIIMSSLRSSRAALAEHIIGTKRAKEVYGLEKIFKQTVSGDMVAKLASIAGHTPRNYLTDVELPEWLIDADAHRVACAHDREIYESIYTWLSSISGAREAAKADLLARLLKKHERVLAFDSRPITLAVLSKELGASRGRHFRVLVATGDENSDRREVLSAFALSAEEPDQVIGLCSDTLSEGVNLQRASAIVHLDMPSVVRIAEQRAGRVDRMDSPHRSIEAWWPSDAPEFAVTSDERFMERYETVESLLGSNMPLPEEMQAARSTPLATEALIDEYEEEAKKASWDGIQDAFEPVRSLVSRAHGLVPEPTYDRYRKVTERVLSRVSLVKARSPWAFFCLAAGAFDAPRWILIPSSMGGALTELEDVCSVLRERLNPDVDDVKMDKKAEKQLNRFLERLSDAERTLLPRKKQRALDEMGKVLEKYAKYASKARNQERLDRYRAILKMLRASDPVNQPDWDEVASRWLDLIRPVWYRNLQRPRSRPLLLKNIRKELIDSESEIGPGIMREFRKFPMLPPPDKRVLACIVGVA